MEGAQQMGDAAIAKMGEFLDNLFGKLRNMEPSGKNMFAAAAEGMKEKFSKGNSQSQEVAPPTEKVGRSAELVQQRSQSKDVTAVSIGHEKEKAESPDKESDMTKALKQFKLTNDVKIAPVNDNMELGNLSAPSVPIMAQQQQKGIGIG
jgi:hypothetical protein